MNFWAWGGKYIGYSCGNILYSKNGSPIGRFEADELYDFSGKYIGEKKNGNRLIVNNSGKFKHIGSHAKPCRVSGRIYCDYAGYALYAGYDNFEYIE